MHEKVEMTIQSEEHAKKRLPAIVARALTPTLRAPLMFLFDLGYPIFCLFGTHFGFFEGRVQTESKSKIETILNKALIVEVGIMSQIVIYYTIPGT